MFENSALTARQFLAEYWQKKPVLLRQAFPEFAPQLDANDIAGLACDEMAESRLVTGSFPAHDWQLKYGPFSEDELTKLPERDWTLLVQDVEKHYPPLNRLMRAFDFLPRWRVDDLMVSVAGTGGSVGPHVDQYDVFLLQAAGPRRWQIANSFDPELLPDCELNVLRRFDAEQEWVLQAGDLLYLPPGIAHHGVALEPGMTWSIGMRAPSAADLWQSYGEWLAQGDDQGGRYRDPDLQPTGHPGEIDASAISRFSDFMGSPAAGRDDFLFFLGEFLSRYRLAHEPAPPETPLKSPGLSAALCKGARLRHNPWTRMLWLETGSAARLFAAGAGFTCSAEFAQTVCDPHLLGQIGQDLSDSELNLLCELRNRGHIYLEQL